MPNGQSRIYLIIVNAKVGRKYIASRRIHHLLHHSFGYAVTWYLLALGTLLAAAIVIRHEWQARHRGGTT